jgi:hypothetical protein
MPNYSSILLTNYPDDQWSISDNDYSTLIWLSPSPPPTQQDLDAQWDAVVEKIAANAYKNKRALEYPSIVDQLDYIYHNGVDAWKTNMIAPVKDKYPKG